MTVRTLIYRRTNLALVLFVVAMACSASAVQAAPSASGTVVVTIAAPAGIPANVVLVGASRYVAAKPSNGRQIARKLSVPVRRYAVTVQSFTYKGRFYVGQADRRRVQVRRNGKVPVHVRFHGFQTASGMHATKISATSLALSWKAPRRAKVVLRRALGRSAPVARNAGVKVRTHGTTAVDHGLKPGSTYSYGLFTKVAGRWTGPVTLTAGTTPTPGSAAATYVASQGTLLAQPNDVASVAPTGTGVALKLQSDVTPIVSKIITLPPSGSLPGGYLGRVTSVRSDGSVILVPASLDDAFDLYTLSVPEFHDSVAPLQPRANARSRGHSQRSIGSVLKACVGGSAEQSITLRPSFGLGGHFNVQIDKYSILGKQIPKGASFDMEFTVTASAALDAKVSASLKCSAAGKPLLRTLTTSPVPISFYFSPVAEATVTGSSEVTNVGATATAGFRFNGSFGLTSGAHFAGAPILVAGPTPSQGTIDGSIGAALGGDVIIGPGAGTADAGVIAGVGGKLRVVDASIGVVFPTGDSRHGACLKTDAASTRELNLTAKAWLGSWDISKTVTFDFLKGRTLFGGAPWYWPTNCDQLTATAVQTPPAEPQTPADSVFGSGVQVTNSAVTGDPGQTERVDGFVPGQKTWVLSTGLVSSAVGAPGNFASTGLGGPGDDDLSALAGFPTHDAATFEVRLIPTGSHLHVRYVFASEEYPEFVGSNFNDVMQVYVGGQPCAFVPGTTTPVSVNTINAGLNSSYFVDNQMGAAGYSTSMDGLTVPLTCDMNVTPGQPVDVKIAVADSSDEVYDSAVALIDQGIWSD